MNLKDFKIGQEEGYKTATRFDMSIAVSDDGDSKIFHRRTIQPFLKGSDIQSSVLVCKLDDTYLYVGNDGNFLLTKNGDLS